MAHFAKIENGIVTQVIVVGNEDVKNLEFPKSEKEGQAYIRSIGLDGDWLQTSYNRSFRKHYAGIGYTYDSRLDAFIPHRPFPSWTLNEKECIWVAPKSAPTSGMYHWDESKQNWIKD